MFKLGKNTKEAYIYRTLLPPHPIGLGQAFVGYDARFSGPKELVHVRLCLVLMGMGRLVIRSFEWCSW